MKPVHFWNSLVGIVFVLFGVAVVIVAAYLLYQSDGFSNESLATTSHESASSQAGDTATFSCPGMIVVALFTESGVQLSLADGNVITMIEIGSTARGDGGVRYATADGQFAFESYGTVAYMEQNGQVIFGECTRSN